MRWFWSKNIGGGFRIGSSFGGRRGRRKSSSSESGCVGCGCLTLLFLLFGIWWTGPCTNEDAERASGDTSAAPVRRELVPSSSGGDTRTKTSSAVLLSERFRASAGKHEVSGWVVGGESYRPNQWHCGYVYVTTTERIRDGFPYSSIRPGSHHENPLFLASIRADLQGAFRAGDLQGRRLRVRGDLADRVERDSDVGNKWVRRISNAAWEVLGDEDHLSARVSRRYRRYLESQFMKDVGGAVSADSREHAEFTIARRLLEAGLLWKLDDVLSQAGVRRERHADAIRRLAGVELDQNGGLRALSSTFGDLSVLARESRSTRSGEVVYVTRTGSKYHRSGCRVLRESKISMTRVEASRRHSPCGLCRP